jgi:hypothetical protein
VYWHQQDARFQNIKPEPGIKTNHYCSIGEHQLSNMLDRRDKQEEIEEQAGMAKLVPGTREPSEAPNAKDDAQSDPLARPPTPIAPSSGPLQRSGRWTPDEKILFLYGLKRFGKGRWKKMSIYLPHR